MYSSPMSLLQKRSAGVLLPLFSLRTSESKGIGEFTEIPAFAAWMKHAGLKLWMMLPLQELGGGSVSPYGPLSAFALEPLYITLQALPEFALLPQTMRERYRETTSRTALAERVEYAPLIREKRRLLRACYRKFAQTPHNEARQLDLERFKKEHHDWLPDYALFRSIKRYTSRSWRKWPPSLRNRDPNALRGAREIYSDDIAYYEWIQWVAYRQYEAARQAASALGVSLVGDLPFLVGEDSSDVWARQDEFRFDASVGVPPDAFSAEGQDWGLPVYKWNDIREGGYAWFRQRGRLAAKLFDAFRVDHVVGLYRTYVRPKTNPRDSLPPAMPHFVPSDETLQRRQGEELLAALAEGGAEVIAEDLGIIPDFVRDSLTKLQIPGYKVFRWENDNGVYRQPAEYPPNSLCTSGTHDTDALAAWWTGLNSWERGHASKLGSLSKLEPYDLEHFTDKTHKALLDMLYNSTSNLVLLPFQDLWGGKERVNAPGVVDDINWTYRMPVEVESLTDDLEARTHTEWLQALATRSRR